MKNANMPASPAVYMDNTQGNGEMYCDQQGLTKREYFAAMAMQGILSNSTVVDIGSDHQMEWASKAAVFSADTLLNELEKDNEQS